MLDLADATDSVRYMLARPGTFADFYPETTDDMLVAVLRDGLAECHLEGLLLAYDSDVDGILSPELSGGQVQLVVLFSALRFLRAELINRNTNVVYKAGSAYYETTQATNILRDIMKALEAQKQRIILLLAAGTGGAFFAMADQYAIRSWTPWGSFDYASAGE